MPKPKPAARNRPSAKPTQNAAKPRAVAKPAAGTKSRAAGTKSRAAGSKTSIGVLAADFHAELTRVMLAAVEDEAARCNVELALTLRVPGCYEAPLAAEHLLRRADVDALVVLGCIERGETLHGEVMGHVVHGALMAASLRHDKPVGFGIIGPGATPAQAEARKEATPRAAVRAVVRALEARVAARS